MPPRIAPSPAGEEPGLQNAVSRLRSSREAQSRLLAERRGETAGGGDEIERSVPSSVTVQAERSRIPGKREGEAEQLGSTRSPEEVVAKSAKEKLVLLYRLPLALESDLAEIAGRENVSVEYVLSALAREGRKTLRALTGEADVSRLTEEAAGYELMTEDLKVIGNPMTVYVRPAALQAMHRAAGDPWCSLPRATVVGGYFTAIVARLIKARRAG